MADKLPVKALYGGGGEATAFQEFEIGDTLALTQGGTGGDTPASARINLELGDSAILDVGTAPGTVAAGDHTHSSFDAHISDVTNPHNVTAAQVGAPTIVDLNNHITNTSNPHNVTNVQVGLANVTNNAQLKIASNLGDLSNVVTARFNLGLGDSAILDVGTIVGTVAAGDHTHVKADVTDFIETDYVHTTGTETVAGIKTFSNDIIVQGDLTVQGTTTTINSNELSIGDNIIVLNVDEIGTPTQDAGVEIERGTSTNAQMLFNETTDTWQAGLVGLLENIILQSTFDTHVNDINNPHAVTAIQVGAATSVDLTNHINDINNPHAVTAVQVGAPTVTDFNNHINNINNPHSVTNVQVGLANVTNDAQLKIASNLSDLNDFGISRVNLGVNNIWETFIADTGSIAAITNTDSLTISGGPGISTSIVGNVLTITNNSSTQNLFETIIADTGSTTADTATDVLTVTGGTGINTSIAGDVLTIDATGIAGLAVTTIGGQEILTLEDTTRTNKVLSTTTMTYTWSEPGLSNNDWIQIGRASDAQTGHVIPFDGTIVYAVGQTENANGNSADIQLYINAVNNGTVGTLAGVGEQSFSNTTLNIDVLAGDKLRLRSANTGGNILDTVITVYLKWRG